MRAILIASLVLAAFAAPAAAEEPSALLGRFMQAWSASDANGIAALFAADADFVSPDGTRASGRDAIAMFYAAAFAHGYAGSRGVGEVATTRMLAPDLALVDGRWRIDGAKTETGATRPAEQGILSAVLRRSGDGWQIVALREVGSATDFHTFPPKL